MIEATAWALDLLWSVLGALVFWSLFTVVFGLRKSSIISAVVIGTLVFGISTVFSITQGLTHIWGVAWVAMLNQSVNVFTVGAIIALVGILCMVASAAVVLLREALDG